MVPAAEFGRDGDRGTARARDAAVVLVAVAVPQQVEAGARPEFDQGERPVGRLGDRTEAGIERCTPPDSVGLGPAALEERDEVVLVGHTEVTQSVREVRVRCASVRDHARVVVGERVVGAAEEPVVNRREEDVRRRAALGNAVGQGEQPLVREDGRTEPRVQRRTPRCPFRELLEVHRHVRASP